MFILINDTLKAKSANLGTINYRKEIASCYSEPFPPTFIP